MQLLFFVSFYSIKENKLVAARLAFYQFLQNEENDETYLFLSEVSSYKKTFAVDERRMKALEMQSKYITEKAALKVFEFFSKILK